MTPYRQAGQQLTGAVQSIRVAIALSQRFAELATWKQHRTLDELGLVLGEARQIYPEIWSNLDAARDALSRQGIEVDGYTQLRGTGPIGGGVLEVEVNDHVGVRMGGGVLKSARLNNEGHAAAAQACRLFQGALPQVDWEGLERADAAELEAAGSLGPSRWKRVVFYTFCALALVAAVGGYVVFRYGLLRPKPRPLIPEIHIKFEMPKSLRSAD